jgi:hypothetical protein
MATAILGRAEQAALARLPVQVKITGPIGQSPLPICHLSFVIAL